MKIIWLFISVLFSACQPTEPQDHGTIKPVNRYSWQGEWAFLTDYGEIACTESAVYYFPANNFDEGKEGYPLNDIAKQRTGVYEYKGIVKDGADLTDAINFGLDICKKNDDL